jgi:hypothetical protein
VSYLYALANDLPATKDKLLPLERIVYPLIDLSCHTATPSAFAGR